MEKANIHQCLNEVLENLTNKSLVKGMILTNYDPSIPEVFFNKETRFDFLVEKNQQKSFIEVKNVTLFRDKKTAELAMDVSIETYMN